MGRRTGVTEKGADCRGGRVAAKAGKGPHSIITDITSIPEAQTHVYLSPKDNHRQLAPTCLLDQDKFSLSEPHKIDLHLPSLQKFFPNIYTALTSFPSFSSTFAVSCRTSPLALHARHLSLNFFICSPFQLTTSVFSYLP